MRQPNGSDVRAETIKRKNQTQNDKQPYADRCDGLQYVLGPKVVENER